MKIQQNVLLKNHTTFRIGGPASYFIEAQNKQEIIKALKWAKQNNLPFFILGGGSNLLVSDKGYKGVVIKIRNQKVIVKKHKIAADAGLSLSRLVGLTQQKGLIGFEWAVGIPGTIGGAIRGNAGAFDGEIKDNIKSIEVFNADKLKTVKLKNKQCKFGYRESIFKKNPRSVILSCELLFKKGDKKKIKEKIQQYLNYRHQKHPKEPSAGSVFKKVRTKPAAILIDQAGLPGKRVGKACVSKKHANFIINSGGAKAKDVISLMKLIKKSVKKKFKASLQEEIQLLGKF